MVKKSKTKKNTIRVTPFINMLKQIHLGGLLDECVLEIKEGKGHTESVDITNSLIVICDQLVASKDINIKLDSLLLKLEARNDSTKNKKL